MLRTCQYFFIALSVAANVSPIMLAGKGGSIPNPKSEVRIEQASDFGHRLSSGLRVSVVGFHLRRL
jgi:hypothetical protein